MSHHDPTVKLDGENGEGIGQNSVEATGEPMESKAAEPSPSVDVAPTELEGDPTLETLNRYLALAAEDREAAEVRSSEVIARFTKLTVAMMCVTMVIAGANVAMIIRQSSVAVPVVMAPPRPVETPTVIVQPAPPVLPAPAPTEPREMAKPAEKIPLLGSPPKSKDRAVPTPGPTRLVRTTPPRPQPLLTARTMDDDSQDPSPVERW